MNPNTQGATAVAAVLLLSSGETVTVRLPPGETLASIRSRVVLLGPDRPSSRTIQHDALLAVNSRLVADPCLRVDSLFVDWTMGDFKGRTSLGAHVKEEA